MPPPGTATGRGHSSHTRRSPFAPHVLDSSQSYEAAKSYVGDEWANAVLRAVFGANQARDILTRAEEAYAAQQ